LTIATPVWAQEIPAPPILVGVHSALEGPVKRSAARGGLDYMLAGTVASTGEPATIGQWSDGNGNVIYFQTQGGQAQLGDGEHTEAAELDAVAASAPDEEPRPVFCIYDGSGLILFNSDTDAIRAPNCNMSNPAVNKHQQDLIGAALASGDPTAISARYLLVKRMRLALKAARVAVANSVDKYVIVGSTKQVGRLVHGGPPPGISASSYATAIDAAHGFSAGRSADGRVQLDTLNVPVNALSTPEGASQMMTAAPSYFLVFENLWAEWKGAAFGIPGLDHSAVLAYTGYSYDGANFRWIESFSHNNHGRYWWEKGMSWFCQARSGWRGVNHAHSVTCDSYGSSYFPTGVIGHDCNADSAETLYSLWYDVHRDPGPCFSRIPGPFFAPYCNGTTRG
jgi:hypothetical protein